MKIINYLQQNASKALMAEKMYPLGFLDRRQFFSTLAVGALAVSPTLKIIDSLTSEPFNLQLIKDGFRVLRNGQVGWEVSKSTLGKTVVVKIGNFSKGWNFSVSNLNYQGTPFKLSLKGQIKKESGIWIVSLAIPRLELETKANFLEFLDRKSNLISYFNFEGKLLVLDATSYIGAKGNLKWELDSSWKISIGGAKQIHLSYLGEVFNLSKVSFEQAIFAKNHLVLPEIDRGTAISLEGLEDWSRLLGSLKFHDDKVITVAENPSSIFALVGTDKVGNPLRVLFAEAFNKTLHLNGRTHEPYRFDNYFFSSVFSTKAKSKFTLSARLQKNGQWISNTVGAFCLKRNDKYPDLELVGRGFKVEEELFEPKVKAFQPGVKDGFAIASVFALMPDIRIEEGQPPIRRPIIARPQTTEKKEEEQKPETQQRPQIQQTPPVQQTIPVQDIQPQITTPVLDVRPDRIRFRPLGPMSVKIIRPEDLVCLEFIFHNFKFTSSGQTTKLELENSSKKGFIEVLFPTQHTLEEAYYESSEMDTGSNQEIRLPARHMRAKRSRLVYELKAGQPGFELSLSQLLDWSKFNLVVHPRANIRLAEIQPVEIGIGQFTPRPGAQGLVPLATLQGTTSDFTVRLAESGRQKIAKPSIYSEASIAKVLPSETAASLRASSQISAMPITDRKVGPIPPLNTSIEAPALMFISPNQVNDFFHKIVPSYRKVEEQKGSVQPGRVMISLPGSTGSSGGEITELWHTSLGTKLANKKVLITGLQELKTIRALWAFDAKEDYKGCAAIDEPFQASLDANDRHKLVHTTSNYSIQGFTPIPVPVKKLMLTTLGAYIDWHGFFKVPPPADTHLNVVEWEHLATLGRDHYVKIVREGYLFPLGHRAALVKVTERKFDKSTKAAVNKMRMYIVVLQKEILYSRNDPSGKFIKYPFTAARIENETTPDIDKPQNLNLSGTGQLRPPQLTIIGQDSGCNKPGRSTTYNFYINVGGKGFPFQVSVTDKEGYEHQINMPLAFVETVVGRSESLSKAMATNYNSKNDYNDIDFMGKGVAYAESLIEGDTQFETSLFKFGAQFYPASGNVSLKFHPMMQSAQVFIKQVDELTGIRKPAKIELEDDNNQGMVFAKISNAVVDFTGGSDKAGGFLMPNMEITGLSKLQGPIGGDIEDLKNLSFVPDKFFKAMENLPVGKIFGVIELFSLLFNKPNLSGAFGTLITQVKAAREQIEKIKNELLALQNQAKETGQNIDSLINQKKNLLKEQVEKLMKAINDQVPKVPNFKTWITPEAFYAEYKWIPDLKNSPISVAGILDVHVAKPKEALEIKTTFEKPFRGATPAKLTGNAKFSDFDIEIKNALKVNFTKIEFKTGTGKKPDIKVGLKTIPIEFLGALSFVNNLQSIIPSGGFGDDGPYINLTSNGVKAGFNMSVPDVEVGVLMISNINLGAYVNLPFNGDELTVGFNFCKRENPFMLTVSCFGGGGYFLMVTSLRGLRSVEAAFEFGAAISLNLGVASGGVSVMGGFYFKFETISEDNKEISLTGYLRINGNLSVLGIINISLEFYLALAAVYVMKTLPGGGSVQKVEKLEGLATLKVKVEVLFFSKTVSITVRRQFAGADADPTFADMITSSDWQEYCLAFAN